MPNAVEVRFVVAGTDQVSRAFDTVQARAQRFENFQAKAAGDDVSRTRKTTDTKRKDWEKLEKDVEKWQRQEAAQAEKSALAEVKATEKATTAKLRSEEAWAKQRARIVENSAKLAFRLAEQEVAAVESAERKKASARERYARAMGHRIGGSVSGLVGGATRMAGMALSLGGGYGIAQTVQNEFASQRTAAQLVNAVTSAGQAPSGANVANILEQASSIAIKTGMSKNDVTQGMLAYARTARGGNFEGVQANAEFFAKMSKTTGASIEDIASAAGTLQSQNADLGKNPAAMQQLLLNAYAQSKSGSVSLTDAAKQFGLLGSTRGLYQGDETRNQQTLMGLGQIAAAGGMAGDIGTYIKDVSFEAAKHQKQLAAMGVKFDATGRMESPEQMIAAAFNGTGGDLGKLEKIFGARGMPLFSELQKSYLTAGGGAAGMEAVTKQIHGVTESTMTQGDLDKQFAQVMSTPAEKLGKAFTRLEEATAKSLAPMIEKLADEMPELLPKVESFITAVGRMVEWAAGHPMQAVVVALAAAVGKGAITQAVADALRKAILGGGGGGVPGGAPGAGGSMLNSALGLGGTIAAGGSAFNLLAAGSAAKDTYGRRGGGAKGLAAAGATYLREWQEGSFGWVWGASWNPLITGARMGLDKLGGSGDIAAGENQSAAYQAMFQKNWNKAHPVAEDTNQQGWSASTKTSYGLRDAPVDQQKIANDLLKQIAMNTAPGGGGGGPSLDARTHPLGASRGGTQ